MWGGTNCVCAADQHKFVLQGAGRLGQGKQSRYNNVYVAFLGRVKGGCVGQGRHARYNVYAAEHL